MDGPNELALLAFAETADTSFLVGEAVLAGIPGSARSEMAVSVADAWQHRGVGAALLADLECRARIGGARYLYGDVLRTNIAHEESCPQGRLCVGASTRSPTRG